MIYSIIGLDNEGKVIPIYFTTNEAHARQWFDSVSLEKEVRGFLSVKLLAQIEEN